MKLSRTARAILSVTALAWSIPFAQATEDRLDAEEAVAARLIDERPSVPDDAGREVVADGAVDSRESPPGDG